MNSPDDFRRYADSISLYKSIRDNGRVSFLQRNIRQALDSHASYLQEITTEGSRRPSLPASGTRRRRRSTFNAPDEGQLEKAIEQSAPIRLEVLPKALERRDVSYAAEGVVEVPDPKWLPVPGRTVFPCSVNCRIYSTERSEEFMPYQRTHDGKLTRIIDIEGQVRFESYIDAPFHFDADKFYAGRKRKDGDFAANVLELTYTFDKIEHAEEFEAEIRDGDDTSRPQLNHLELCATWKKLPDCPDVDYLMNVSFCRGRDRQPLEKWRLRADFFWSLPVLSALQRVHGATDPVNNESSMEVDDKSESTTGIEPGYSINYIYTGDTSQMRSKTERGFRCTFCQSTYPLSSFDHLRFHYLTHHEHFHYTVMHGVPQTDGMIQKVIKIDVADPSAEQKQDQFLDEQEFEWIAPTNPFDMRKYLDEGNRSWVKTTSLVPKKPSPEPSQDDASAADLYPTPDASTTPMPIDVAELTLHVPDLPVKRRKAFKVPDVPGVTFFRASSKRYVEPDEMLEESDDDIDDSWLDRRIANRPMSLGSTAARRIMLMYNAHMKSEVPLGDRYLPHAIVRFIRKRANVLCRPDMRAAFETKLHHLELGGQISSEWKNKCVVMLNLLSEDTLLHSDGTFQDTRITEQARAPQGPRNSATSESKKRAAGAPQPSRLRVGLCICGKPCTVARAIIYCANINCPRSEFHLQCMGLSKRKPGWRCRSCRASTKENIAPVAVMS
ncbi:hypothetical protein AAFC00_001303 [Neodothiora populina]|uniref:Polycomb protein VEFS-Box domain-containing protein n=1 Tax=Neodothiora populina TaxID=2781224 RepID=A0ABR3PNP6_9PEZI